MANAKITDFGNTQIAAGSTDAILGLLGDPDPGVGQTPEQSMSGTLVSHRFDGWMSAYVDLAAVRAPWHRWRPHPSTPHAPASLARP